MFINHVRDFLPCIRPAFCRKCNSCEHHRNRIPHRQGQVRVRVEKELYSLYLFPSIFKPCRSLDFMILWNQG
jgi:hypothetical protein